MPKPKFPVPVVQALEDTRILIGLYDSKPGSCPVNPSWVEFSDEKEARAFLDEQNKVFRKSSSAKQPVKAVQAGPGMASTSLRHPKGGVIFEVIADFGGDFEAYKRSKAQEIGDAERARRERAEVAVADEAAKATSPKVTKAKPTVQDALESNIPYRVYRAANKIMKLDVLDEGFEANNPDMTIPTYGSKEAFVEAMLAAYPLPVKSVAKPKAQQEDRKAKKLAENENPSHYGRDQRRNRTSWNSPKRFATQHNV
jgi:hypothetical protein